MGRTLNGIIEDATTDLKDAIKNGQDPDEAVFEIADSATPVYTSEIVDIFAEDNALLFEEPETGEGGSIVEQMTRIVYEQIRWGLEDAKTDIVRQVADLEAEIEELELEIGDIEEELADPDLSEEERMEWEGRLEDRTETLRTARDELENL